MKGSSTTLSFHTLSVVEMEGVLQELSYQAGLVDGLKMAESVVHDGNGDAIMLLVAMREKVMARRVLLLSEVFAFAGTEPLLEVKE